MSDKYIRRILEANVYDVAVESPLDHARQLSKRLKNQIYLKREDQQQVFSFKLRGAYNKIRLLDASQRERGVVTASAGNHAQGVALAATRLGVPATIVMGKNTPSIKVEAVRHFGGKVVLYGDSYDEAAEHAATLMKEQSLTYVHPFDDPDVIAGQGTIGMEILRQHVGDLEAIFIPVGGGGLIAGIGTYVKYLRPEVRIIGVEAEGSASMWAALDAGKRVKLKAESLDQFADGTSVAQVGKETYRLAKQCVDEVIRVSIDEICAGIKDIFEDTRSISEPSGALAVAGLKRYVNREGLSGANCIAVVSGANMNFDRLRHVSERTEIGERREILLGVTIPEEPGSFRRFCADIGKRGITEFNYRCSPISEEQASVGESSGSYSSERKGASVLVGIQTSEQEADRAALTKKLGRRYRVVDLSDNEVAVLHVRHMVGGRTEGLENEHLFRFEFPERPGALMKFLDGLGTNFNITMFHYRNHGSADGRVLVGIQIPAGEEKLFKARLRDIGYRYWEETDNPAYRLFLS